MGGRSLRVGSRVGPEDSIGRRARRGGARIRGFRGGPTAGRLRRRLDGITRGADGTSLDAILDAHLDKVYAVARELDELSGRSAILEAAGRRAIQRVGLVRFNPFEDTGVNQSFALALTDAG